MLCPISYVWADVPKPYVSPQGIHLTWQNSPESTMTICWMTPSVKGYIPSVSYGTSTGSFTKTVDGSYTQAVNSTGHKTMIHTVELTGLTVNSTYYYRCGSSEYGWSYEHHFTTAPDNNSHVRFAVIGDSRSNISARTQVIDAIDIIDPSFILHTGDFVNHGGVFNQWRLYFDNMHHVCSNTPFLPCPGNHDTVILGRFAPFYYKVFALPNNERWYSFDYNNIHVVMANSEEQYLNIRPLSAQYRWLESDLKEAVENQNISWIIVCFHRPPYNSGTHHGNDTKIQKYWCPLFDTYHVDLVFNGHEHTYERTFPLNGGVKQYTDSLRVMKHVNGTIYVVSGGAGAPLYDSPGGNWVASKADSYHFCMVDVYDNHSLHLEARAIDQQVLDGFWLKKGLKPIANFSCENKTSNVYTYQPLSFVDQSYDLDGEIANREWWINNESISQEKSVEYSFTDEGEYHIHLRVTDNTGFIDNANNTITILNRKPLCNFSMNGTTNISCDQSILFTSTSIDHDGFITAYTWYVDDEMIGTNKTVSHRFSKNGSYVVSLKVMDDDGASSFFETTISVKDNQSLLWWIVLGLIICIVFFCVGMWWLQRI